MLFYIDQNNQIVGRNADLDNVPSGWSIIEGDDLPLEEVYFDGMAIAIKPPQPSPDAVWSVGDRAWIVPAIVPVESIQDFAGLEARFRNSAVWFRVWSSAGKTLRANVAFTVLFSAMTTHHNLDDIRFAFNELRAAMQEQSTLNDFTSEELEFVGQSLIDSGFSVVGFNLFP